jgi:hypothetical protein
MIAVLAFYAVVMGSSFLQADSAVASAGQFNALNISSTDAETISI